MTLSGIESRDTRSENFPGDLRKCAGKRHVFWIDTPHQRGDRRRPQIRTLLPYYPTNTDPHRESKFCMVIKRDERKFLHSPLPCIGGGGTIFVARMLTRDLFAVANLLVLFVYYLFRLEHFEHSLTH